MSFSAEFTLLNYSAKEGPTWQSYALHKSRRGKTEQSRQCTARLKPSDRRRPTNKCSSAHESASKWEMGEAPKISAFQFVSFKPTLRRLSSHESTGNHIPTLTYAAGSQKEKSVLGSLESQPKEIFSQVKSSRSHRDRANQTTSQSNKQATKQATNQANS